MLEPLYAILWLAAGIAIIAVVLLMLYYVVKTAVRNGINESLLFADRANWQAAQDANPRNELPSYGERWNQR